MQNSLALLVLCLGTKAAHSGLSEGLTAYEAGNEAAQLALALMNTKGEGVNKDASGSVHWHRRAAEQGNAKAQLLLGEAHYIGEGVDKDMAHYPMGKTGYRKKCECR